MTRHLQAQGLVYGSYWVVAMAKGANFNHVVVAADGSTLADGKSYGSAEIAIAAGKQLIDQKNTSVDEEAFRWIG